MAQLGLYVDVSDGKDLYVLIMNEEEARSLRVLAGRLQANNCYFKWLQDVYRKLSTIFAGEKYNPEDFLDIIKVKHSNKCEPNYINRGCNNETSFRRFGRKV